MIKQTFTLRYPVSQYANKVAAKKAAIVARDRYQRTGYDTQFIWSGTKQEYLVIAK